MAFGFPAYAEGRDDFGEEDDEVLAEAVEEAAASLGWMLGRGRGELTLIGSTSVSFWSWGEKITVTVDHGEVHVRSHCALPTQCIDWGKNQRNVDQLLGAIEPFLD